MARRARKPNKGSMGMASLPPSAELGEITAATSRQIPLLCCVCPETPHFSDVSHLLTHIASKGHLHHETQTKLKAHQDAVSSLALQQYDQWYRDNGIEALLVDRMRTKQVKEASRNKRSRPSSAVPPSKQTKKKPRRPASNSYTVKSEKHDLASAMPIFPGFLASDNDTEIVDELFATSDMMSLKGQIWPGMGKMDLANEEMKRTRNQRKPKSVVEKMRRTSEGIEPTQVVMTPQFDVERIKGVYDEDSPVSDHEEQSPPRKPTRSRRKKAEPLAEVSANVPRGRSRRFTDDGPAPSPSFPSKPPKTNHLLDQEINLDVPNSLGPFRPSPGIFRDDESKSGSFETGGFPAQPERDQRFDVRDRFAMYTLNPISHATLASPTSSTRELPSSILSWKETSRAKSHGQPYFGQANHSSLGSFSPQNGSYSMNEASTYHHGNKYPFSATFHCNGNVQDQYRLPASIQAPVKQDELQHGNNDDVLGNSCSNPFLGISSANMNPLLPQDRLLFNSYSTTPHHQVVSPLGLTSVHRSRERSFSGSRDQELRHQSAGNIKIESQAYDTVESCHPCDGKEAVFIPKSIWPGQSCENDFAIHDSLQSEDLDL